ncbi:MAG: HNH endonuclease [Sedimentisphaerales bacterium]|nr:HNH endonuclease [Sedimentisphaerales bacterium]
MEERACWSCARAQRVFGLSHLILICRHRPDREKRWHVTDPRLSCSRFQLGQKPEPDKPKVPVGIDPKAVRFLPLGLDRFAMVDPCDYAELSRYSWKVIGRENTFYAFRWEGNRRVFMHRQIANASIDRQVDHIDHDGLNNTRANLRLCTQAQNVYNMRPRLGTSKYKGVSFDKRHSRWRAQIQHQGVKFGLGYFSRETEAAKAYDQKARQLFGEFAYLNFPDCDSARNNNDTSKTGKETKDSTQEVKSLRLSGSQFGVVTVEGNEGFPAAPVGLDQFDALRREFEHLAGPVLAVQQSGKLLKGAVGQPIQIVDCPIGVQIVPPRALCIQPGRGPPCQSKRFVLPARL